MAGTAASVQMTRVGRQAWNRPIAHRCHAGWPIARRCDLCTEHMRPTLDRGVVESLEGPLRLLLGCDLSTALGSKIDCTGQQ